MQFTQCLIIISYLNGIGSLCSYASDVLPGLPLQPGDKNPLG